MTERKTFETLIKDKGWTADSSGTVYNAARQPIGHRRKDGYVVIPHYLNNKKTATGKKRPDLILAHRFVWFYLTRTIPLVIDHKNHKPWDNSIKNLRSVSTKENSWNRKEARGYYKTPSGKFAAQIKVNGKLIYLGLFETEQEARASYLTAKRIFHIIK